VKDGKYSETALDGSGASSATRTSDPFSLLRKKLVDHHTSYRGLRFVGGLVGYISYDATQYVESLSRNTDDDLDLPDFEFGLYNDGIVFDHSNDQAYYYWYEENRSRTLERMLSYEVKSSDVTAKDLRVNVKEREYASMVEKAKKYVKDGDIFQVVLSKRFEFKFKGDLINFYRTLRKIKPSPYMYFLKMKEKAIVGSSPEMLGRVERQTAETFPIAGTRPIGANAPETKRLASDLLRDPKERAEHIMLVDLARNDLGKVCRYGTVTVPDFMTIQKYSHVQHMVSSVTGELRPDKDSVDVLEAIFPAGTVSGAPKKRAMEIIDELEQYRRGPYAGAVGYFSFNGNADFAITIRTLVANGDRAYIQAGAGIVADSKPRREWFETEHKARALLRALGVSRN
jgi:anthranilate synthase component 1